MGAIEEIQGLSDGQFHRLGDHLLRRVEVRYRRLRTHGLNDRGESIKGQPDSYLGDTASKCSVSRPHSCVNSYRFLIMALKPRPMESCAIKALYSSTGTS